MSHDQSYRYRTLDPVATYLTTSALRSTAGQRYDKGLYDRALVRARQASQNPNPRRNEGQRIWDPVGGGWEWVKTEVDDTKSITPGPEQYIAGSESISESGMGGSFFSRSNPTQPTQGQPGVRNTKRTAAQVDLTQNDRPAQRPRTSSETIDLTSPPRAGPKKSFIDLTDDKHDPPNGRKVKHDRRFVAAKQEMAKNGNIYGRDGTPEHSFWVTPDKIKSDRSGLDARLYGDSGTLPANITKHAEPGMFSAASSVGTTRAPSSGLFATPERQDKPESNPKPKVTYQGPFIEDCEDEQDVPDLPYTSPGLGSSVLDVFPGELDKKANMAKHTQQKSQVDVPAPNTNVSSSGKHHQNSQAGSHTTKLPDRPIVSDRKDEKDAYVGQDPLVIEAGTKSSTQEEEKQSTWSQDVLTPKSGQAIVQPLDTNSIQPIQSSAGPRKDAGMHRAPVANMVASAQTKSDSAITNGNPTHTVPPSAEKPPAMHTSTTSKSTADPSRNTFAVTKGINTSQHLPGSQPGGFGPVQSITVPLVPKSMQRDLPRISSEVQQKHVDAGAGRNIVGHATKEGFEFEPHNEQSRSPANTAGNLLVIPDGSSPISVHQAADLAAHRNVSASGRLQVDVSSTDMETSVTLDNFMKKEAERGSDARSISGKMRKAYKIPGIEKYTAKAVQGRVKELTGRIIEIRNNRPGKQYTAANATVPAKMHQRVTGGGKSSSTPSSAQSPTSSDTESLAPTWRHSVGQKAPLEGWRMAYLRTVTYDEDEEFEDYEIVGSTDNKEEESQSSQPFHVYTAYMMNVSAEEEEDPADQQEGRKLILGEYVSLQQANEAARKTALGKSTRQGAFEWSETNGLASFEYTCAAFTTKTWVEKTTRYKPGIQRPSEDAMLFPWRVYEIVEDISLLSIPQANVVSVSIKPSEERGTSSTLSLDNEQDTEDRFGYRSPLPSSDDTDLETTLLHRGPITTDVYTTLEEANTIAAKYVLEKMIMPNAPKTTRLGVIDVWKAEQVRKVNELKRTMIGLGECLSEVRVVKARNREGEWERRVWKIEVLERRIKGVRN